MSTQSFLNRWSLNFLISFFPISEYFDILFSCVAFLWWSIIDLLFQLTFVCFNWRWNIFLWYISIVGKYLKWKNRIDPVILNKMIIGSPHILSSPSLNISISYFHLLHFFNVNSLYVVSYPCIFLPLLLWSIIGPFVSIDVCLYLLMKYISMIYFYSM